MENLYATVTEVGKKQHKLSDGLHFGVLLPTNPAMRTAPFVKLDRGIRETPWFMCPFEWAFHWGNEVESPLIHQSPEFKLILDIAVCKRFRSIRSLVLTSRCPSAFTIWLLTTARSQLAMRTCNIAFE